MSESLLDAALFDGHLQLWRLALTSAACFLATAVSVAAGVGGGGLLVPLYSVALGLGPKLAVPISKATIFGVALGNVPLLIKCHHPREKRPLIDCASIDPNKNVPLGAVIA